MQNNFLISFCAYEKFGPANLKKISSYFDSWEEAWDSSQDYFIKIGINSKVAEDFFAWKNNFDLNIFLEKINKENIKIITIEDDNYPKLLKEIYDPPFVLYLKGDTEVFGLPMISIVGSRKFTNYGKSVAEDLAGELAKNNICIVSGMAIGIDSLAHEAALKSNGKTIAIVGSGVSNKVIYPQTNLNLSKKIVNSGGAVFSEFLPDAKAQLYFFPMRNRVISGISLGTIVVEAGEKSGTLITAYSALDQGREVFAVPGSIYSNSSFGTHKLIKEGAQLITSAKDILNFFELGKKEEINKKYLAENEVEIKILDILSKEPKHINEIILLSGLSAQNITGALAILEIKSVVKNLGSMQYALIN